MTTKKKKRGYAWRGRPLRRSRASQIAYELEQSGSKLLRVPKAMETKDD